MIFILSVLSLFMIAVLLMLMLAQARPWVKADIPGKVIQTVPMSLWQRFSFFRSSLAALALGILLGRAMGWLSTGLAVFAGIFALVIVLLPIRYTFTTRGVAVGQAIFRSWDEFCGVMRKPNQVILEHPKFLGQLKLFIKPAEFDRVLVQIKTPYQ